MPWNFSEFDFHPDDERPGKTWLLYECVFQMSGGRTRACCTECLEFKLWLGSPRIFKIDFHQLKLSSVLIECDIKLGGAFYSVFHAEASKDPGHPWTNRVNARLPAYNPSLRLPLAAGHTSWLSIRPEALRQWNTVPSRQTLQCTKINSQHQTQFDS